MGTRGGKGGFTPPRKIFNVPPLEAQMDPPPSRYHTRPPHLKFGPCLGPKFIFVDSENRVVISAMYHTYKVTFQEKNYPEIFFGALRAQILCKCYMSKL